MAATSEGAVATGSAEAQELERALRSRYTALWQDAQRELEKYHSEQYADIVGRVADPGDASFGDLLVDLNVAEIDRDVREMRAIQHAIERLKSGTYGICASCGEPIPLERLRAMPHAPLCVECQSRTEQTRNESPSL